MNTLLVPLGSTLSPLTLVLVGILLVGGIALFIIGGMKKKQAGDSASAKETKADTKADAKADNESDSKKPEEK